MHQLFFDITSSTQWGGPAVGIIRVERELARRACLRSGDTIRFCVYDKNASTFYEVARDLVPELVGPDLSLTFDRRVRPAAAVLDRTRTVRGHARRTIIRYPRLYQIALRMRGYRYSLDELRELRDRTIRDSRHVGEEPAPDPKRIGILEAMTGPIEPGPGTTIISGGLDWEHKDMRAIGLLKEALGFRYLAIVYDLIALDYPHFVVPGYVDLLADYFGELVWTIDGALCISQATARDLGTFCERLGVAQPTARVFPLGSDLDNGPGRTASSAFPEDLRGKRFGMFVSTIEPRKNHRVLYEAWDWLIRDGRVDPSVARLVFVGRKGWAVDDLVREIKANPATRDTILMLDQVDDDLLQSLYREAAFTLFPSHYEGYGLPLAEALGHGKPCLASDAGSLPEIGGDAVVRLPPRDTARWAEAIETYMNDPARCDALAAVVRSAFKPVTWDQAADEFFECVRDLGPSLANATAAMALDGTR